LEQKDKVARGFNMDIRQIEIHTDEPLVPGPSRLVVEIAIANLKILIARW
jgi:hypothetical protein